MTTNILEHISARELHDRQQQGLKGDLIDVRSPVEFREIHAAPARNVPLDKLRPEEFVPGTSQETPLIYVICRTGSRAAKAAEKLVAAGNANVRVVEGGTMAWEQAGLPVVRGKKSISLERQVRIAAGSLVVLGVLLAWLVHPAWMLLSAFVGTGLVFAGVTDTCGMGLLLARMPWNKVEGGACGTS